MLVYALECVQAFNQKEMKMRRLLMPALLLLMISGPVMAQDDFRRERGGDNDAAKNALEGKTPPALQVGGWMNTDGAVLKLSDLRGKVVILDFWGTW
ncbi:peroxiredoxin family protein [Gemmatimonadota bacterium]